MIMCGFFSCLPRRGVEDDDNAASALVSSLRNQHPVPVVAPPLSAPDSSIDLVDPDLWSRRPRRKLVVGRSSSRIRIGQRRQKSRLRHAGFALATCIDKRASTASKGSEARNNNAKTIPRTSTMARKQVEPPPSRNMNSKARKGQSERIGLVV